MKWTRLRCEAVTCTPTLRPNCASMCDVRSLTNFTNGQHSFSVSNLIFENGARTDSGWREKLNNRNVIPSLKKKVNEEKLTAESRRNIEVFTGLRNNSLLIISRVNFICWPGNGAAMFFAISLNYQLNCYTQ